MDDLKQLAQIDWWYVFVAVILALVCVKLVWSLFDWLFVEKLGIETKKMKQRRQESELLKTTAAGLSALEKKHDKEESELKSCLTTFIEETRNTIKAQDESNRKHWEESKKIRKELTDTIKELADDNQKKCEQIGSLIVANKEMLAEKINEKYKYYISIGGIPEDEYDEFVALHKAYNGVGGNHHGDAKFEYCMEHLPMISVETKLVYKENK
jgi:septal ring factor EnvC (AmiA/AmiB activator)